MTTFKDPGGELIGKMTALVPILYRKYNITGVLNHEVGTHFLRKYNDEL